MARHLSYADTAEEASLLCTRLGHSVAPATASRPLLLERIYEENTKCPVPHSKEGDTGYFWNTNLKLSKHENKAYLSIKDNTFYNNKNISVRNMALDQR